MVASSSFSVSHQLMKTYDVFLSFRGADVRNGFLSHLQDALVRNGIDAFIDENLERGEEISESLLKKIEESYISVVIFSENYAFSPWCLEELVKILECKKTMGQMVIPVFYRVDPTKIQELQGSYGDALIQHRENFKDSFHKVECWAKVLEETGGLSGLVSCNFKSDAKLIEEIVSNILQNQDCLFFDESCDDDGLVGIGSRVKCVESLLRRELAVARIVGIWGMPGIGKTTLAEKVFDQISGHFESQCFVANVSEKFHKCRHSIQNELLSKLFRTGNIHIGNPIMLTSVIRKRLSRKKVLVVFDDVSDLEQIKPMIGKSVDYAVGSRVIVTSRDRQLLKNVNAEIYEVEELGKPEALELFCLHAFKQNFPREGFTELSQRAVEYAQGLPLALKVFGSDLYGRYSEECEDQLEKLKGRSDEQIMRILRTSYDGLCTDEKEIFLDIACFFNGKHKDRVLSILNFAGSRFGLTRLCDKFLVSISRNKLYMHDLLRQMGKDIICEEKKLKQRSRLLNPEDIYHLLTEDKGTKAVKGISLDVSKIRNMYLTPSAFEKMCNLRYLELYNSCNGNETKVCLSEGLNFLPEELRCLCWSQYPLKSLPLSFCAEKLVELHMCNSQLQQLWNGVQNLVNLKQICLSYSKKLTKIPDLSRALNLEVLNLRACKSLAEIPLSLKYLSKLTDLDLSDCFSLRRLPSCLHLISLKRLDLLRCSITKFPNIPCYAEHPGNTIEKVHLSIGCPFQLSILYLDSCSRLKSLPDSICNLIHLRVLSIRGCINLCELPHDLGNLKSLEALVAYGSGIKELPDSVCNMNNCKWLNVNYCVYLHGLPKNLGNMKSLKYFSANGSGLKELPESICNLKNCRSLSVSDCVSLCRLPENLGNLESLKYFSAKGSGINELPNIIRC